MGSHPPWHYDENLNKHANGTDAVRQTRGSLRIAEEFLRQLRQNETAYDRSAIIIMADHGVPLASYFPSLMVKRAHEHKTFKISDAPVSYEDLVPTIMEFIGVDPKPYGPTIYQWQPGQSRERRFLLHLNDVNLYLPPITEKLISGDHKQFIARDSGSVYLGGQGLQQK